MSFLSFSVAGIVQLVPYSLSIFFVVATWTYLYIYMPGMMALIYCAEFRFNLFRIVSPVTVLCMRDVRSSCARIYTGWNHSCAKHYLPNTNSLVCCLGASPIHVCLFILNSIIGLEKQWRRWCWWTWLSFGSKSHMWLIRELRAWNLMTIMGASLI